MQRGRCRYGQKYAKLSYAIGGPSTMVASQWKRTRPHDDEWRVGDRVRFRFGLSDAKGTIVAKIGPVAKNGRMLYRIQFHKGEEATPLMTELTADEFAGAS